MFVAIVPAYMEEKNLGSVIRDLLNPTSPEGYVGQVIVDKVIVVDDGSTDNTAKVARESGAVVLRHKLNRGQGAALQTGHEYAKNIKADFVLHFDGDGQFDVADINPAYEKLLSSGADILFGSRFLGKDSNIPFFKKNIIFPMARIFNKYFTKLELSDSHNGFRILNSKALDRIHINQDRMAHATEIIEQVSKKNLKFVEFPVKVVYRDYGQGFSGGLKVLTDLFINKFIR